MTQMITMLCSDQIMKPVLNFQHRFHFSLFFNFFNGCWWWEDEGRGGVICFCFAKNTANKKCSAR